MKLDAKTLTVTVSDAIRRDINIVQGMLMARGLDADTVTKLFERLLEIAKTTLQESEVNTKNSNH